MPGRRARDFLRKGCQGRPPYDVAAGEALEVVLASPRCVGVTVTELNPSRDVDGTFTRRLAGCLAAALAAARRTG